MGQAVTDYFGSMETGADIKDDGDFLGGYSPFESGLYDFIVELAYLTTSAGGARCLNVVLKDTTGKELKQQFWYTSGTSKGCKNFYLNNSGEKQYLPGFIMAQHLSKLTTGGKDFAPGQLVVETRTIKLYNAEAKKEVPTEVAMCTEMLGKPVTGGVIKRIVDKNKKSDQTDASGKIVYLPTGETRVENELVKFFRTRDRMTVTEILGKAEQAAFAEKWAAKWTGQVEDKSSKNNQGGTAGLPSVGAGAPVSQASSAAVSSLFS